MSQTYQPRKRKRQRVHGFRRRSKSVGGRLTLQRRRRIGRKRISL